MDNKYKMEGLAHVGLFILDVERSKEFYTNVLHFEVVFEVQNTEVKVVFVKNGNLILELVEFLNEKTKRTDGLVDHVAINVNNIENVVEKLRERGIVFETDKITYAHNFWNNGSKWILFRGPDGEHLELNEIL